MNRLRTLLNVRHYLYGFLVITFVSQSFFERVAFGQNVVVQQPTFGVSVDAKGVLTAKAFPGGKELIANRIAAAKANLSALTCGLRGSPQTTNLAVNTVITLASVPIVCDK